MAICNLFKSLSKKTGNVMMFSQYSEDLTQCYVQHDNYDVIPSRFVALNIDYSKFRDPDKFVKTGNPNIDIPTYLQNYFENGCAWMRGTKIDESWKPTDWDPNFSTNLFWNALLKSELIGYSTITVEGKTINTIPQVKYVGNIDIHSYEARDGVGYSEVYCYIPNAAEGTHYEVVPGDNDSHYTNSKPYIEGYDDDLKSVAGALTPDIINPNYYYGNPFNSVFTYQKESENYQALSIMDGEQSADSFVFNTIIVLYDVMVKDADANITVAYKNVPMAMFLTGLIGTNGSVTNEVLKYSRSDDAYGAGTSYGLRLCTRYTVTANATTINNIELDVADQYAGFSRAMDAMAKSQSMMNDVLEEVVKESTDIKDHLANFRNYRVNVPYTILINNVPYWFVNGRNTGVCAGGTGKSAYEIAVEQGYTGTKEDWIESLHGTPGTPGEPGDPGMPGNWWYHGTELNFTGVDPDPKSRTFNNYGVAPRVGDLYINETTGDVYEYKTDGVDEKWVRVEDFTLKGNKGDTGAAGANGIDGIDGNGTMCRTICYLNNNRVGFIDDSDQKCKTGDLVVYTGPTNSPATQYDLYVMTDETFEVSVGVSYKTCRVGRLQGNIKGAQIISMVPTEYRTHTDVLVTMSDGSSISYRIDKIVHGDPQFSSFQRNYACWDNVVYHSQGNELWVEIPYTVSEEYSGGNVTFGLVPVGVFGGAQAYRYIIRSGSCTKDICTNGYKKWSSDITHTVNVNTYSKMKEKYNMHKRMAAIHLYITFNEYCALTEQTYNNSGIVYASYDYKTICEDNTSLKWIFEPKEGAVTVARHNLTCFGNDFGNEDISHDPDRLGDKSAIWTINKHIRKKQQHEAIQALIDLCLCTVEQNAKQEWEVTYPIYTDKDGHKVAPDVWIKWPTHSHNAKARNSNGEDIKNILKNGSKYVWRRDLKHSKNRNNRNAHFISWSNLWKLFNKTKLRGSGVKNGKRKYLPYLEVAIFDRPGAIGYLYRVMPNAKTTNNEDSRLGITSNNDLRISFVGRVHYFKKTR
jgi:hypothetical protein